MAAIDLTGSDKGSNGMQGRRRKSQSADEVVIVIVDDSDNDNNDDATAQSLSGHKKGESRSTNAMSERPIDLAALHSDRETRRSSAAAFDSGGQGGKGKEEDVQGGQVARGSKRAKKRGGDAPPIWQGLNGAKRLMAEFKDMQREIEDGGTCGAACGPARLGNLRFHEDNMYCWRMELSEFDEDNAEGRQLNADLRALKAASLPDKILVEVKFPQDFPRHPFSLRIVRPRFQMYTGHITAGGSVCIQALTTGSSSGHWQSDYSLFGIIGIMATNMLDNERQVVQTATGPGGMSGPARIDMRMARYEYSEAEASAAFIRMNAHHAAHGW